MNVKKNCSCTIAGKSADCQVCSTNSDEAPGANHVRQSPGNTRTTNMDRETKDQPSMFRTDIDERMCEVFPADDDNDFDEIRTKIGMMMRSPIHNRGGRMIDDSLLLERNRASLRKFEPLSIDGNSLISMSIGGFNIDVPKAAQKAQEVLPVPAAKLPLIFVDETLNFYFHFFDGMGRVVGHDLIELISTCDHHVETCDTDLIDAIEEMLRCGFERTDSEQLTFLKKTMIATFDFAESRNRKGESQTLTVAANLYGFQYIEPGMRMKENDLRDWINRCHGHFKTLWFNTFKSTAVPSFAHRTTSIPYSAAWTSTYQRRITAIPEGINENGSDYGQKVSRRKHSGGSSNYSRSSKSRNPKGNVMTKWISNA
jgi:hypothetical protein